LFFAVYIIKTSPGNEQPPGGRRTNMQDQLEKKYLSAANRVTLARAVCPIVRELYGVCVPVLDVKATLRRVALFATGSGTTVIPGAYRPEIMRVLNDRWSAEYRDA
jgi:hypothetical protein